MSDQKLAHAYDEAMETIVKLEDEIERLKSALKEILRRVEVWTDMHFDHCSQADEICTKIENVLGKTRDEILGARRYPVSI